MCLLLIKAKMLHMLPYVTMNCNILLLSAAVAGVPGNRNIIKTDESV